MSLSWVKDIRLMHEKFGVDKAFMDGNLLRFRQRFLEEELKEFDKAITNKDPEGAVDALIDLCVVAIGTLDIGKVDSNKAWDEVLDKNMKKEPGENSSRYGSGGFDLIKPEGWVPPNHKGNTGNFGPAIDGIHARQIGFEQKQEIPASHIQTMDEFRAFAFDKNHDYNGDDPEFQHATYYPNGITDIVYEISKKVKRIQRNLRRWFETGEGPKTESVRDSFRDINIYSAIGATYLDHKLEGQWDDRDVFNRQQ
jgi:predicted HAD superfamily Cof-like phosphohydrolase